jgi:hypothetical protein
MPHLILPRILGSTEPGRWVDRRRSARMTRTGR